MDYMTLKEAAEKWGVTPRRVNYYCAAGCIGVTDYTNAITAIKNGGYATSPTYISTITSIIKKYNLTQYDACMADGTPAKESKFTIGKNYILQANMYVRDASCGNKKQYIQLTTNAKSHTLKPILDNLHNFEHYTYMTQTVKKALFIKRVNYASDNLLFGLYQKVTTPGKSWFSGGFLYQNGLI